MVEIFLVV